MLRILTLNTGLTEIRLFGAALYEDVPHVPARAAHLAEALRGVDADIVLLQELVPQRVKVRLAAELRDLYPHSAGIAEDSRFYGTGLLTLSRDAMTDASCTSFAQQTLEEGLFGPRGMLACTVRTPDLGPVRVINLHATAGGRLSAEAAAGCARLAERAGCRGDRDHRRALRRHGRARRRLQLRPGRGPRDRSALGRRWLCGRCRRATGRRPVSGHLGPGQSAQPRPGRRPRPPGGPHLRAAGPSQLRCVRCAHRPRRAGCAAPRRRAATGFGSLRSTRRTRNVVTAARRAFRFSRAWQRATFVRAERWRVAAHTQGGDAVCAFCTMMAGGTHWTEAGTDAGRAAEPETGRARYLGRLNRVALINRILNHYGCAASDWASNQYVVKSHAGRSRHGGASAPDLGCGRGDRRAAPRPPGPCPARHAAQHSAERDGAGDALAHPN